MANITLGRVSRLHFDFPETVVREGFYGGVRLGSQVASIAAANLGRKTDASNGVRYWPSVKCWTLEPLQERYSDLQEPIEIPDDLFLFGPTEYTNPGGDVIARLVEMKTWRKASGNGLDYEAGISDNIDKMLMKQIPAGGDWTGTLPVSNGYPQGPLLNTAKIPLDTLAVNPSASVPEGLFFRWVCPGSFLTNPDYVANVGFGEYLLCIDGSGMAHLCEYCRATPAGSYRWKLRKSFRYSPQAYASGRAHSMLIKPLRGVNGEKYIIFVCSTLETVRGEFGGRPIPSTEVTYIDDEIQRLGDVDESPDDVYGPGVRIDARRDLRILFSLQRLKYRNNGYIQDSPWQLPPFGAANPVQTRFFVRYPVGDYKITARAYDRATGLPLTAETTFHFPDSQSLAIPDVAAGAVIGMNFSLGKDGSDDFIPDSPTFYGYDLSRLTVTQTSTPGGFDTPLSSLSVVSSNPDPRQDTGETRVNDLTDAYPRLRSRGELPVKATVYAEGLGVGRNETALITLFRGKAIRPRRTKYGVEGAKEGGFNAGNTRVFPSPEWSAYSLLLYGMAHRAEEQHGGLISREVFGIDESAPSDSAGNKPPWKVTDIVRLLLGTCGFPSAMIEIADNPIRLFSGISSPSDQTYDPNVNILERCINLVRNYLGANLIFCPNSGPLAGASRTDEGYPEGAWRIVYPVPEGTTPIFHFLTKPSNSASLPTHAYSYAYNETWAEGPLESYTIPPECNHILVFTAPPEKSEYPTFQAWRHVYNFQSYAVPGSSITPDPDSPHFLGRERLVIVPAPHLFVDGQWRKTQQAVDFTAVRLLNYIGRARKVQPLRGPLAFVYDSEILRWRTLRYGDPVTWKGESGWYVRSVTPEFEMDTAQMAIYELEQLVPL